MGKGDATGDHSRDQEHTRPGPEQGQSTAEELDEAESKLEDLKEEADRRARQQRELDLGGYKEASSGDGAAVRPDVQRLDEAHEDFYDAYQNVIRREVPKCQLRDKIWAMGRLYLKEGQTTGADCRQARPSQRADVKNVVLDWVLEDGVQSPSTLFNELFRLNKEAGYKPERVL